MSRNDHRESDSIAEQIDDALERQAATRKRWIDGTVNLSHILGVAGIGLLFWAGTLVNQAKQDGRIDRLESDRAETKAAIVELNKNVNLLVRGQDRMADTLKNKN